MNAEPPIAECPMCTTDFEPEVCRPTCPLARGCRMTRCPRCGYEFIPTRRRNGSRS